jgi:hypothetical protein
MPQEQPTADDTTAQDAVIQAPQTPAYEPYEEGEQDEWLEQPEELPRRARHRVLGAGANRVVLALIAVLMIACGFIGGVLVEKGETSSSSPAAGAAGGLASRFAALRGGSSSTGARSSATGADATGGFFGGAAGGARPTTGTVAYLDGSTLYVTNSEGNTVKVTTSAGTSVTKNVKASVDGVHPGETVTITGTAGSNGAVSAESISVGSSGGGLAALFGGSRSSSSTGGSSSTGAASLFGG